MNHAMGLELQQQTTTVELRVLIDRQGTLGDTRIALEIEAFKRSQFLAAVTRGSASSGSSHF